MSRLVCYLLFTINVAPTQRLLDEVARASGGWPLEMVFWLVVALVTGYVLLFYAAFRMFASDSNKKSMPGAVLLLLLTARGLLPLSWLGGH